MKTTFSYFLAAFFATASLCGCPLVRATGDTVEATGEGVSHAVTATGEGIGHAVEGTGDAIGRAGHELAP